MSPMSRKSFWIGLAAFLALYLSLRLFWLAGDPGISAVWEYGYNATDEGYYLGGGKEKLLWNCFVDLSRTEAFTYGFSAGTHFLSYLAHLVFGLSTWTWRIPFFLITCVAWIVSYVYLARKSGALNAALLCTAVSSVPMIVAYERTASNDVLIGALIVIAYVIATGRSRWRIFAAAAVTGLVVLVKPSVWALLPIVAAGVLQRRKFSSAMTDIVAFVLSAVAAVFLCKALAAAAVLPDAHRAGVGVWEIIRRTTTHYPLPDLLDFASHFKGISAFPRDPSYALLGVTSVFLLVLPVAMMAKNVCELRFNAGTLLFASVAAYVAAINVMNTQYTHYFIPAVMMLPILLDAAAEELGREGDGFRLRTALAPLGITLAACAVGLLFLAAETVSPQTAQHYYSRIYNFPSRNVWGLSAPALAVFVATVVAALVVLRGFTEARRRLPAWIVSSFVAASVVFAALPAVHLAPHLRQPTELYFAPMAVALIAASLLLVAIFGVGGGLLQPRRMAVFAFAAIAVTYLATPNWRQAARELLRPPTYLHAAAAEALAPVLPEDAIVIGERSSQMLMSLPVRTATTFAANSDPIPVIRSILAAEPDAKLYALVDSQHAYNLQHYREHADEYALQPLKTLRMPSFATGEPADVHLCRIRVSARGKDEVK